jgi:hypothetical protein
MGDAGDQQEINRVFPQDGCVQSSAIILAIILKQQSFFFARSYLSEYPKSVRGAQASSAHFSGSQPELPPFYRQNNFFEIY